MGCSQCTQCGGKNKRRTRKRSTKKRGGYKYKRTPTRTKRTHSKRTPTRTKRTHSKRSKKHTRRHK